MKDEIRLLNELEKKRNKIRKEAHEIHMDKVLDKMGAPVKWIGYKSRKQSDFINIFIEYKTNAKI